MKISTLTTLTAAVAASAFTLAGCDVDAEPGTMPEFDVEGPGITTGTETIEVPTVGIDIPEEGDAQAGETEAAQELEENTGM